MDYKSGLIRVDQVTFASVHLMLRCAPCAPPWILKSPSYAEELARREGRTAGAVASDLIRRGLARPTMPGVQEAPARYGFRPFVATPAEDRVTNEAVNRLRDELGI